MLLRTKFAFWFPPFSTRICTEDLCLSARKIAPVRMENPRPPAQNPNPPTRKIHVLPHDYPQVSARNHLSVRSESTNCPSGHTRTAARQYADYPSGSVRKKLSFSCHVPYLNSAGNHWSSINQIRNSSEKVKCFVSGIYRTLLSQGGVA